LGGSHARRAQQLQRETKCGLWLKGKSKMLWEPNGSSTTNMVNLELLQGTRQETFAPVARLESIHILLAYATHHDFKLYQFESPK
jgi:hypothetical protein